MDRQIVYPAAIPLETDLLNPQRFTMTALGTLAQAVLGTSTLFQGLACTPTSPASLQIQVGAGSVTSLQNLDNSAFSSLAADTTHQIVKQGIALDAQTFTLTAPTTAGTSQVYLVEACYLDSDTNPVVLPYYNSSNPTQAYSGPGNTGVAQDTLRKGVCSVQVKAGVAAATGSQTIPAADTGYTPLYAVTVAQGQSTIIAGNIAIVSGAPFITETLTTKISQATGDARYLQIGAVATWAALDSGAANAYAATLSPAPTAYAQLQRLSLLIANTNTGASTLNLNALGAKAIRKRNSAGALVALTGGELVAGTIVDLEYDGTNFQLLTQSAVSGSEFQQNAPIIPTATGGTADALTATYAPAVTALTNGMTLLVRAASANATTTPTFTPNSGVIAAAAIVKGNGLALAAGDIAGAGHWIELQYDTALGKWVLMNPATGVAISLTGYAKLAVAQVWQAPQTPQSQVLADAATIAWDVSQGQVATVTTSAARTIGAPTNGVANTSYRLVLNSGGYTPSWSTAFKFALGVAPSALIGKCIFDFHYDGTNFNCVGQSVWEA
jgi:hypothetical protein